MKKNSILLAACLLGTTLTASAQYMVMPSLPIPVATAATNVSEYGFRANWQAVDAEQLDDYNAPPLGYYVRSYVTMTATQDKQVFYLLNTDFSQLKGSIGTLESPENYISDSNPYSIAALTCDNRAGWQVQNQAYVNGVLCLNGAFSWGQSNGALICPVTDMSGGDGVVHFSFKIRGDGKSKTFAVLLRDDSTFPNTVVDGKIITMTEDWVDYDFTLSGGVKQGDILLTSYETGTGENMYYFLDDVKIWQELNTGETAQMLYSDQWVLSTLTTTNTYVETGDLYPGEDYGFTVSSYSENGISRASNLVNAGRVNPYDPTAITLPSVTTDPNAPVYDLAGRRITEPTQPGIYIQGGRKFVVK